MSWSKRLDEREKGGFVPICSVYLCIEVIVLIVSGEVATKYKSYLLIMHEDVKIQV